MSTLTVKLCRFKLTNEAKNGSFTKHANKNMQKKIRNAKN